MESFGTQQFTLLVIGVAMIAVGYLGLTGQIIDTDYVLVGCFIAVMVLSFSLGRQSARYV
ncbi:hypothetical protein SAMN04487948_1182 [Halogranum amylolyticum]|uniref:Uncharacterized protein n=1 Tax=Halogranum amylolyticum TaxID=660520 RepID=A0A1H8VMS8_9EURY|nr:hypothetical protein [Halogranum amylolyticum]SEP16614.1 hypothetical protein SAMN04487948_1182 [Halogranum amylolyticum]